MASQHINMQQTHQKIGKYLLGRRLGKGTFAQVRQAFHVITKQTVAIKILDKQAIKDDEDTQRILRQIDILRKIRHPNIIQLYQILQTDDKIYMVTQYAENGQLFKLISRQQKLKQHVAGRLFLQLINAVKYLHRIGVSHRDLKPQNILLDFDYNIKLIDFGLSNYVKDKEFLSTACGSPCYAPPQMVSGKKYDGFQSDVWSMGIIFYVMICGYLPFQDQTTKQLYKKIIKGVYQIPQYISQQAKQVIQKMLITEPLERIKLKDIRNLPFFQPLKKQEPQIIGIIVGVHPMPIDLQLLQQLKPQYNNIDTTKIQQYIRSNRHNQYTTSYYLFQKKILRQGGKTNIDLQIYLQSSSEFKKQYGTGILQVPPIPIRPIKNPTNQKKWEDTKKIILKQKSQKTGNRFILRLKDNYSIMRKQLSNSTGKTEKNIKQKINQKPIGISVEKSNIQRKATIDINNSRNKIYSKQLRRLKQLKDKGLISLDKTNNQSIITQQLKLKQLTERNKGQLKHNSRDTRQIIREKKRINLQRTIEQKAFKNQKNNQKISKQTCDSDIKRKIHTQQTNQKNNKIPQIFQQKAIINLNKTGKPNFKQAKSLQKTQDNIKEIKQSSRIGKQQLQQTTQSEMCKKKQKIKAINVFDAYLKNTITLKSKKTNITRPNLKQKQIQQIFKQNLKQLKQGFTKLPEIKGQQKQHKAQKTMQNN